MPPNLLAIFAPNPPLKNLTPLPAKKHFQYTGLTDFIPLAQKNKNIPVPRKGETPKERKAKRARRQKFINKERIDKQKTKCNFVFLAKFSFFNLTFSSKTLYFIKS